MKRLEPTEARSALAALLAATVANHREVDLDEAIALALKAELAPVSKAKPELPAAPLPRESKKAKLLAGEKLGPGQELRGRPSKRAQAWVPEQLAAGPKPGETVMAAARRSRPARSMVAARPGRPQSGRTRIASDPSRSLMRHAQTAHVSAHAHHFRPK